MAYALQSLVQILEQVLLPQRDQKPKTKSLVPILMNILLLPRKRQNRIIKHGQKPQIESLLEKVISLQALLNRSSLMSNKQLESLESQIRDATYRAEDIIESYTAGLSSKLSSDELEKVIHEFDSTTAAVVNILDGNRNVEDEPNPVFPPTRPDSSRKDFLVGVDDDLIQLKDRLTGHRKKLEIIPIVGMGGIGKTTVARKIYDDPFIMSHFDVCSWVTISQDYDYKSALLGLVRGIEKHELTQEMLQNKDNILVDTLYKYLFGRRYLIVLDDIWSTKVWDDIKICFPDDDSRSRIVLTTRENDVANHVDPNSKFHVLHLLEKNHSWELLRHTVFAQERCPPKLQPIGEKIADNCGGIPLAIIVIGGLLSTEKRNQDFWAKVSHDSKSIITDKHEFLNIFSFSYNHLPSHLKPCFLYFGAFPEDSNIRASKLIKLWIAEGFLKPIKDRTLEEVASIYLKSLVDRNLISVHQQLSNTRVKSYGIHDLLRDLCVRKAIEEKFLNVKDPRAVNITLDALTLRRMSFNSSVVFENIDFAEQPVASFTRSLLCFGSVAFIKNLTKLCFTSRLLRILDLLDHRFDCFPEETLELINLRYLAIWCRSGFPSSISRLTNLQTLIALMNFIPDRAHFSLPLPSELWQIACLRHVKITSMAASVIHVDGLVLENLQTLANVIVTQRSLASFPNLKSLGIVADLEGATDFTQLDKLQSLKYVSDLVLKAIIRTIRLPHSLKKLSLTTCEITQEVMSQLASSPNLEVLKLKNIDFHGQHWEVGEGGFPKLQFLRLKWVKLREWTVEDDNAFPNLQRLVISSWPALIEIPSCIGHAPALQMIEVDKYSNRAAASAMKILDEQREYGNYDLRVRITS